MLRVDDLSCAFDDVVALEKVSVRVEQNEIVCLLGPSGCGKTTLLRIIAGLISVYRGDVSFNGQDLRPVLSHKRGFGLMFQDFALFPHMSVADNIGYGLRRQGVSVQETAKRVDTMLTRVGLMGYGNRDVVTLSGGEKQRVALARSLAPNPRLLMLDEPLGSLDALLRDQLALELREIIKASGISALYVTHDHREAYAIADRIAVMQSGTIQQVDKPDKLYHQPANEYVARFLGFSNVFRCGENEFTLTIKSFAFPSVADDVRFLIHPDGIALQSHADHRQLKLSGLVERLIFRGDHHDIRIRLDEGTSLGCKWRGPEPSVRSNVDVFIAFNAIILLD